MTTKEVADKLVKLCSEGKFEEASKELYAKDIVSVEAGAPPGQSPESKGIDAVLAKSKWWAENHEVHSAKVDGPFPHGDRFAVMFEYDITRQPGQKRIPLKEGGR